MDRRTKIVATIGPASRDDDMIRHLIKSGVNVARLNLSHGTHEDHTIVFNRIRTAAEEMCIPICILLDLQGPKIRIAKLPGDSIILVQGQRVTLTTRTDLINTGEIPVDFTELPRSVHEGGRILLDDGNLELRVEAIEPDRVTAQVIVGGVLKSHKGISLPEAHLNVSALTEKDVLDLEFGLKLGVDAVALSFVRSKQDLQLLREKIKAIAPDLEHIPIIAKLERSEAIDHLEEIMEIANGVMVARGDLGVEMSPQEVPIAQKRIIDCANRRAKVVITATQMLESMIHNPRPTRAEASDVANAIFDGTDAVMLSGETAVGDYPIEAVEMMGAIICQAEAHVDEYGHWSGPAVSDSQGDDTKFMSLAVRELAHDRNVAAIAVFTMSGRTALHVSKTRPGVPILAFTPDIRTFHRLEMYWGVTPYLVPNSTTLEDMLEDVDAVLIDSSVVAPGQQIALTCGFPVATISPTNLVLLHTIRG
ncbi:MAG: pyruvate kinase [Chloroflexi bacterium RBG_19FT_COMBO_49_13]|nr:MAG: pyruvate kinase [Chloroflexi bacterium RBG_19FT_COMBO_49_13]